MSAKNSAELVWTVEGVLEVIHIQSARLSECLFFLECLSKTEWEVELWMWEDGLFALFRRASTDDGPEEVEVDYEIGLLKADGERWGRGERERRAFRKGGYSDFVLLSSRQDLLNSTNRLVNQNGMRIFVRMSSATSSFPQPLTLFARSSVMGTQRTVTCSLPRLSTFRGGETREFPVSRMKKDDSSNLKVVLFIKDEQVCVGFRQIYRHYVVLEAVHVVQSNGVEEKLWEGKQILLCSVDTQNIPFARIQNLMQNKSTYLSKDELTVIVTFTDCTECHPNSAISGTVSNDFKFSLASHQMLDRSTSPPHSVQTRNASVDTKPLTAQSSSGSVSNHSELLSNGLTELLEQETFSDFNLRVATEFIPVHRCILSARSPVFKALLSAPMVESSRNEAQVPDFRIDTVRHLVRYMYTGSVPDLDPSDALELYSASDKYCVLSLRDHCSRVLVSGLCPQTVGRVLTLSDRHRDDCLKKQVLEYIENNEGLVIKSPEWAAFLKEDPVFATEVLQNIVLRKLQS